jgi:tRNA A-37 threonylcarbamoyl transferase component Bud32
VLAEGAAIGAYRVLYQLGEGGMGVVYVGEHALLGRRAAIKVLLPSLSANAEILQRFFNEARALTQITDPGIVQVFDFGQSADGSAFIIMELLEGEPFDRRLARLGRFSVIDTLRLLTMICRSLGAAHAKGIVHRDLKPENLFIVGDPAVTGGERPKILDFGIAKLSNNEPSALKTRTGTMMGTPVYMSPEQCRGAGDIDHRSDIYSIGCVMMTMLTGRPPFEAEASGELIVAHLREPPPLIASRVPGIPAFLDQIAQCCLAKSPADRFASMADLADALTAAGAMLLRTGAPTAGPRFSVGAAATSPGQLPPDASAILLPPTTTLGGATGQTVLARPARAPPPIAALVCAAIAIAGAATVSITYVVTRAHRRASAAASSPVAQVPVPVVTPAAPPALPLDASVAPTGESPRDRALPSDAGVPDPGAPGAAVTDVVAVDAGTPDAAPRPPRPHRASSTRRTIPDAASSDPAPPDPVDRGD